MSVTKVIADGPRQTRVGVAPEDDDVSHHDVGEVRMVGISEVE